MTTGARLLRGAALGVLAAAIVGLPATAFALAVLQPAPVEIVDGRLLSWSGYPADAAIAADEVVGTATAERAWTRLRDDLRDTLDRGWGLPAAGGEPLWRPQERNGYGGPSLLTNLVPAPLGASAPPAPQDRRALFADLSAVAERHGLGALVLLQDEPGSTEALDQDQRDERLWSIWTAHAEGGGARLSITLLDRDGQPTLDADEHGLRIEFQRSAIADADRPAYERAIEPYRGLEPPPASGWD